MIKIRTIGASSVMAKVRQARRRLGNTKALHAKGVVEVDKWIQRNFDSQGQLAMPSGWPDISDATKLRKGSTKILIDHGFLRKDWKHFYNSRRGVVESKKDYAKAHHYGYPERNIPARPIIPTPKQMRPILLKVYGLHLRMAAR